MAAGISYFASNIKTVILLRFKKKTLELKYMRFVVDNTPKYAEIHQNTPIFFYFFRIFYVGSVWFGLLCRCLIMLHKIIVKYNA